MHLIIYYAGMEFFLQKIFILNNYAIVNKDVIVYKPDVMVLLENLCENKSFLMQSTGTDFRKVDGFN